MLNFSVAFYFSQMIQHGCTDRAARFGYSQHFCTLCLDKKLTLHDNRDCCRGCLLHMLPRALPHRTLSQPIPREVDACRGHPISARPGLVASALRMWLGCGWPRGRWLAGHTISQMPSSSCSAWLRDLVKNLHVRFAFQVLISSMPSSPKPLSLVAAVRSTPPSTSWRSATRSMILSSPSFKHPLPLPLPVLLSSFQSSTGSLAPAPIHFCRAILQA
ncbi:hypothetical protein BKA93DRAFT_296270 [Sparassis latifolia]